MLSSHPLSLVALLRHIDVVKPIFPGMSRIHALEYLFKAAHFDPARILQQTVSYDRTNELTVSVSWGYAIQLYEENKLLPEVLSLQRTLGHGREAEMWLQAILCFTQGNSQVILAKDPSSFF